MDPGNQCQKLSSNKIWSLVCNFVVLSCCFIETPVVRGDKLKEVIGNCSEALRPKINY